MTRSFLPAEHLISGNISLFCQRSPEGKRRSSTESSMSGHIARAGKVLIPTSAFVRTLIAARLAADVCVSRLNCHGYTWSPQCATELNTTHAHQLL